MPRKGFDGIPKRRSSSLKERFFVSRGRKTAQSARARIQSTGSLKACREGDEIKGPMSTKYKFVKQMSVRIYTLGDDSRNPWERLMNSRRFPWSWDSHTIVLGDTEMHSPAALGMFTKPIPYVNIFTWAAISIPQLPFSYIKMSTDRASYLIQAADAYQRDRLLYSVRWKVSVCKHEKVLYSGNDPQVIIEDLKELVKLTVEGPLYLDDTNLKLLDIVSNLLVQNKDVFNTVSNEALIMTLAPLFEENQPSIEICNFFTKHCRACPRSRVVIDMFLPVVLRILKYNTNYGKNLYLRTFVREYVQALSMQNDGEAAVRAFVQTVHGPLSICPHKQILNNLFAVCLSAIYGSFTPPGEKKTKKERMTELCKKSNSSKDLSDENSNPESSDSSDKNDLWDDTFAKYGKDKNLSSTVNNNLLSSQESPVQKSETAYEDIHSSKDQKPVDLNWKPDVDMAVLFAKVIDEISTFNDWRESLAILIQPVPFQTKAMQEKEFMKYIVKVMERIIESKNDEVIWCLVSIRENKDGWLQIFSPQRNTYNDEGAVFTQMVSALLGSAKKQHKMKKLVTILMKTSFDAVLLLALRENETMIQVLVLMLEYKVASGQNAVRAVSTLRSTKIGTDQYERLCEQEMVMRQQGGPESFTLPPRSTDKDLHKFLNSGPFGNLKSLNLSFTYVTSKSADSISRLPSLQHLNLWSSAISDLGLRRLCECLNLQTLNLCETRVTDDGIICLKDMKSLTNLNLNSTRVTNAVYQELKQDLPNLVHCDVTYTEVDPITGLFKMNNDAVDGTQKCKKVEYTQNV